MDTQRQDIKKHMNSCLQDIMKDGAAYRWPVARDFHATWLQHIEMGRATWDGQGTQLKLRQALRWHRVVPPPPHTHRGIASHPPSRETTANHDEVACPSFNAG